MFKNKMFSIISDIPNIKIVRSDDSREEMTLTCIVDSHPPADISWRKDGREVSVKNTHSKEVSNKNIHSREVSDKIVRSQSETAARTILYMKNLDRDNFGAYTCIAENSLGREELTTYISGNTTSMHRKSTPNCQTRLHLGFSD